MAKYIKQEFKSINNEGEASAYYRMETSRRVTMAEFIKEISIPGYGISEATAVQVLSQAATSLARLMAHGCAVTIDGIGTFKATIGVCKDKKQDAFVENEPQHIAVLFDEGYGATDALVQRVGRALDAALCAALECTLAAHGFHQCLVGMVMHAIHLDALCIAPSSLGATSPCGSMPC